MKIIDRKHLCTFITLRDKKIMKFLCLVLKLSKNYKISLFGLKLLATTVVALWLLFSINDPVTSCTIWK